MEMPVEGIVPGEVYGVEIESTAQKQSRFAKFLEAQKERRKERADARQAKRDEKIFAQIRAQLVKKVFHRDEKHIKGVKRKIDEYEEKTNGMTEADQVDNMINIADGASADKNTSIAALGLGGFSTAGGVIVSGIESETAFATLTLIGGLSIPITLPFIVGAALAAVGIGVSAWVVIRTIKGKKSDALMKQLGGLEKAQEFVKKIEQFVTEIEKDKPMLIEKRKLLKKKGEFEKFLEEYIQTKAEFLKQINVKEFVEALRNAEIEESSEKQNSTPSFAGAMA